VDLPDRQHVARAYSESEAFAHAGELYDFLVTARTPPESAPIVGEAEAAFFRPACELQLAGLCLLGGRDFPKEEAVVVSLACFAIDHLLWGWTAAVNAQPRVAATLSRAAVEASIFAVAASENYDAFERAWTTHKTTGGAVLKSITSMPPSVRSQFANLWKLVVPFGHASVPSVMEPRGTFTDGDAIGTGISFAGQFAGPMSESILARWADVYGFGAVAAAHAMSLSLASKFTAARRWQESYAQLALACETPRPIPKQVHNCVVFSMCPSRLGRPRPGPSN